MSGRHRAQNVEQCVACAALTLIVRHLITNLSLAGSMVAATLATQERNPLYRLSFFFFITCGLELSDTKVYEP